MNATDPFDPDHLRLEVEHILPGETAKRPYRHRHRKRFIKGPIPLSWVSIAAVLPGKALAVGMFLWHDAGWRKKQTVKLSLNRLSRLDIHRNSARRGLLALERAGLVSVARASGRAPLVTLLACESGREIES